MKRMYEMPRAYEEGFMANEYVAACYDYKAILYCSAPGKDKNHCGDGTGANWGFDGLSHGAACAQSTQFNVEGSKAYETADKTGNPITNISIGASADVSKGINSVYISQNIGQNTSMTDGYYKASWNSSAGGLKYDHYGLAQITGAVQDPNRPNHS